MITEYLTSNKFAIFMWKEASILSNYTQGTSYISMHNVHHVGSLHFTDT